MNAPPQCAGNRLSGELLIFPLQVRLVISTLERQRLENHDQFDVSLNYVVSPGLASEPDTVSENKTAE